MTTINEKEAFGDALRAIVTFRFLSDRELGLLLGAAELLSFEEGETVVAEGELSPYFYGIVAGSLSVAVGDSESGEVYVSTLGLGDVFGEAGMFMQVKRTATVRAQSGAVLMRLHRRDLARFLKAEPDAGNKILLVIIYSLLRKLRSANQELAFERKSDLNQDEIDAMMGSLLGEES